MVKKQYVCDECQQVVRDLAGHKRRVHGKEEEPEATARTPGAKKLELVVKPKKKETTTELGGYHCVDCGETGLSERQSPCPSCGATLDWSQV